MLAHPEGRQKVAAHHPPKWHIYSRNVGDMAVKFNSQWNVSDAEKRSDDESTRICAISVPSIRRKLNGF